MGNDIQKVSGFCKVRRYGSSSVVAVGWLIRETGIRPGDVVKVTLERTEEQPEERSP